jgi:hypothetical protein
MHVSLLLGAFWGVIAYGEQTSCPEPVQKDVRGNESKIGEMRANKCNAQVTGHIQGGGQFRPTKTLSSKDELALDGLFFAPEVKEIERHTRLKPKNDGEGSSGEDTRNREKGKDLMLEELKSFSVAMKLETAPPEDILSVIGKSS